MEHGYSKSISSGELTSASQRWRQRRCYSKSNRGALCYTHAFHPVFRYYVSCKPFTHRLKLATADESIASGSQFDPSAFSYCTQAVTLSDGAARTIAEKETEVPGIDGSVSVMLMKLNQGERNAKPRGEIIATGRIIRFLMGARCIHVSLVLSLSPLSLPKDFRVPRNSFLYWN